MDTNIMFVGIGLIAGSIYLFIYEKGEIKPNIILKLHNNIYIDLHLEFDKKIRIIYINDIITLDD